MKHKRNRLLCMLAFSSVLLLSALGQSAGVQADAGTYDAAADKPSATQKPDKPQIIAVGPMAVALGACETEPQIISVGPQAVLMAALLNPPSDNGSGTDDGTGSNPGGSETMLPSESTIVGAATDVDEESEYADLAIAHVRNYVNIRSGPGTDYKIVGKIYDGAVAHVLEIAGEENDWFKIISGNAEGYIKSEFFYYGRETLDVIDDYVTRYAVVQVTRLNVRQEATVDSKRIGYLNKKEKVKILENQGDWLKVQYTSEKIGYVASEYVNVEEEFIYAKTLAEEAAEIAAKKELEERQHASEKNKGENVTIAVTPPSGTYENTTELRKAIVDYAMQFLGNKYVHGGKSLVTGTDCSGFTSLIYKEFGYSISRTPSGQLASAGRAVSVSDLQPGDIICYGNGGCSHVGMYIGDGKIIHSSTPKNGVVIANYNIINILGCRSVVD